MIRYPADPIKLKALDLNALATAAKSGWLTRAAARTTKFKGLKRYSEKTGIWSEIKPVYMVLQHEKCAYCERQFSKEAIEHDLEHFRPKSDVQAWPDQKALARLTRSDGSCDYNKPLGPASATGYYLLAYHTGNYCASCKVCNTIYKLNYFPVAGPRKFKAVSPTEAKSEEALLLYPIGDLQEAPESLIRFEGLTPVPKFKTGLKYRRARVTIDFFNLDCREDLLRERARHLVDFARAWQDATGKGTAAKRTAGQEDVDRMRDAKSPHSNCVRCFQSVLESDPKLANKYLGYARKYLQRLAASQK